MTYSYPVNMTGMLDFVKWESNILTYHGVSILPVGILMVFWFIIFSVSRRLVNDTPGAAMGASFICGIVAILFFITGLVDGLTVLIIVILLAASTVFTRFFD